MYIYIYIYIHIYHANRARCGPSGIPLRPADVHAVEDKTSLESNLQHSRFFAFLFLRSPQAAALDTMRQDVRCHAETQTPTQHSSQYHARTRARARDGGPAASAPG